MPKKAYMWIISGLFPQNCAGENGDSSSALHCPYVQTSCHLKTSCSARPLPPNAHNDNSGCRWSRSQQRWPAHSTPLITNHLPSRLCHRCYATASKTDKKKESVLGRYTKERIAGTGCDVTNCGRDVRRGGAGCGVIG